MKSITIIGILLAFLAASNGEKKCPLATAIAKSVEACKEKLSEENRNLLKEDEYADNEEIRCFKACVMNHSEIMVNKKIDVEKIGNMLKESIEDMPMKELMEILNACKAAAEEASTDCEIAGVFSNCFKDATEEADDEESEEEEEEEEEKEGKEEVKDDTANA